ncbi:MAG TPA: copper transporter [Cryptosporangiaceae bacterium]|nr:copper transporter [Cryptosporangiaceae bacterium]
MINFRYHVVSLTSIFLALAIGLVLGTAALNGPVADDLNDRVSSLSRTNGQLREEVSDLRTRATSQDQFVREVAPMLLTGKLTGRTVVVVTTPTAEAKDRDAVVDTLRQAGATITGQVALTDDFTDPKSDVALQDLASRVVPDGVTGLPTGSGVETASALLAAVLLDGSTTIDQAGRSTVLTAYTSLGVLAVDGKLTAPASAVVVITGPPAAEVDGDKRNAAAFTAVRQFDAAATYMVVAAPTAGGNGSILREIRSDGTLAKTISTVDGVSLAEGQVATGLALVEQFAGRDGHYGTGDGATARIPALVG